jgi:sirohydrochlorin ferrochelatase
MIVALIDNGSLEPAAHRHLRAIAAALSQRTSVTVHAVSWKHSDRVPPAALDNAPAWTLGPFVRSLHTLGQRTFVFVPFFVSPQGAIGSALRADLDKLQHELGAADLEFTFADGLVDSGRVPMIVAERIRAVVGAARHLQKSPVVVVDHGGPSAASAALRDKIAAQVRALLGADVGTLTAASMEGRHPPLLGDCLQAMSSAQRDVIVAPLFLSPGRHAGPAGDIARICAASPVRCHVTELVGTHPLVIDVLGGALQHTLSTHHTSSFA